MPRKSKKTTTEINKDGKKGDKAKCKRVDCPAIFIKIRKNQEYCTKKCKQISQSRRITRKRQALMHELLKFDPKDSASYYEDEDKRRMLRKLREKAALAKRDQMNASN